MSVCVNVTPSALPSQVESLSFPVIHRSRNIFRRHNPYKPILGDFIIYVMCERTIIIIEQNNSIRFS